MAGSIWKYSLQYIPESKVKNLHQYKYSGTDKSLITKYVQTPIWMAFLRLVPMWVAPNLLTLIGLMFSVASYILVSYYCPELEGPIPCWVLICCAVFLYFYQLFDAIDGKQARRTGTSGPLGELFDHGCDCLNTFISGLTVMATVQGGSSWKSVVMMYGAFTVFFISSWETFHTGTMYFGYINFPQEGLLAIMGLYAITGIMGVDQWRRPVSSIVAIPFLPEAWSATDVSEYFTVMTCVCLFVLCCATILGQPRNQRSLGDLFRRMVRTLMPFLLWMGGSLGWLLSAPELVSTDFKIVMWAMGLCFCKILNHLILCNLVKNPYPVFQWSVLLPWVVGIINSRVLVISNHEMAVVLCVYAALLYSHYVYGVITIITVELDIWCLRIKPKAKPKVDSGDQGALDWTAPEAPASNSRRISKNLRSRDKRE